MLKLCIKKIMIALLYVGLFVAFGFIFAFIFALFFGDSLPKNTEIIMTILTIISLLLLTLYLRVENTAKKEKFVEFYKINKFSFLNDIKNYIVSAENIANIIAITTLCTPFFVCIAIIAKTPIIKLLLGTLLLDVFVNAVFLIINIFIWYLVHRIWIRKRKLH